MLRVMRLVAVCLSLFVGATYAATNTATNTVSDGGAFDGQSGAVHEQAFVVLGAQGQPIVRVLTTDEQCPDIDVDGKLLPTTLRAAPAVEPLRETVSAPANSKPAVFSVRTCELSLPHHSETASLHGQMLPLPPKIINSIVVIGDTGCRIKGRFAQDCNDPQRYPFARIASLAAQWHPDIVVHVGDYLYRENACPAGNAGCAGSPWGYGSDSWQADFFQPARALLRAAPWVMVRGNHESCARAGQGWWRFLDPHPLREKQDCNLAANDKIGDFADAYAVPLGQHDQFIILDTSDAINKPLPADDFRAQAYARMYQQMLALAKQATHDFILNHQPILGVAAEENTTSTVLAPGNQSLQSVFKRENPRLFPDNVDALFSGHVHIWEALDFRNAYPAQFITGFSGTDEDMAPMPAKLPAHFTPYAGAIPDDFSSWIGGFGYMTMQRSYGQRWDIGIWNVSGDKVNTCHLDGKRAWCDEKHLTGAMGQVTAGK